VAEGNPQWSSGEARMFNLFHSDYAPYNTQTPPVSSNNFYCIGSNGDASIGGGVWINIDNTASYYRGGFSPVVSTDIKAIEELPISSSIIFSGTPKEGSTLTTTINLSAGTQITGNLVNGAKVYWSISGIRADDLASNTPDGMSGSGVIQNNKLVLNHALKIDSDTGEQFKVSIYSDSARTQRMGAMSSIVVQENNQAPTNLIPSATAFNENIPAGSTVATLASTDPDAGNIFTYTLVSGIGGADNTAFSVSGNQLQINTSPNFEVKNSYGVRIRTTDQGGLSFEKSLTIMVNDLDEQLTSSTSTILNAEIDTLTLTGTKNIFGTGNARNNTIVGNSGRNRLSGGLGKDLLTGGGGADTFFYGSRRDSLLGGFDVITDYSSGEFISCGFEIEGQFITSSTGMISALTQSRIGGLLTISSFAPSTVEVFTVSGMSGVFAAINDGNAGYQSGADAIIHLPNYSVSSMNPVIIV
jgi:Ca2+-binding RTX toxin-like protein